jgi:hypothetical protein
MGRAERIGRKAIWMVQSRMRALTTGYDSNLVEITVDIHICSSNVSGANQMIYEQPNAWQWASQANLWMIWVPLNAEVYVYCGSKVPVNNFTAMVLEGSCDVVDVTMVSWGKRTTKSDCIFIAKTACVLKKRGGKYNGSRHINNHILNKLWGLGNL